MPKRTDPDPAPKSAAKGDADEEWDKLSQREKFIRAAREAGADETGEVLDEALRAVGRARKKPGS